MAVASASLANVANKCYCYLGILPWDYLLTQRLCSEMTLQLVSYSTVEVAN